MSSGMTPASELQQVSAVAATNPAPAKNAPCGLFGALFVLTLILVSAGLCYRAVCVNAFLSDDYLHVSWLRDAAQNPELLVRNFHSAWLDGFGAKFYRPLISVFMYTDYKTWGVDARGFHLTNILFHLAASAFLFGIGFELNKRLQSGSPDRNATAGSFVSNYGFPLCASALFAFYPLHPESVSWITGRVDCVVTAFFLGSVWCYMRWQATEKNRALWGSLALFALALMSKEMAVVLPATLTCLELFAGKGSWSDRIKRLAPYWLCLAGYFAVRKLALGTFIGGYDDSLSLTNPKVIFENWKHGLMKIFVPINTELIDRHNFAFQIWNKSWRPLIALSLIAAITSKRRAGIFAFLLFWFAGSLVPVYKIFWISENLEGSRLAYLSTAPLCLMFAFAIFSWRLSVPKAKWCVPLMQTSVALLLCWSAAYLLTSNNKSWATAGEQMQAIQAGLREVYKVIPGDPDVILMGLPDSYSGAYMARNAISGLTRQPMLDRDISNAVVLDRYEPIYPFGARKDYLALHHNAVHVFRWDEKNLRFDETRIPAPMPEQMIAANYNLHTLRNCLEPVVQPGVRAVWAENGNLTVSADPGVRPQVIFSNKTTEPFFLDYLRVGLKSNLSQPGTDGIDVLYANDFSPSFRYDKRIHQAFDPVAQDLLLTMRAYPEWAFGKQPASLAIVFPAGWKGSLSSISVVPAGRVTPRISVPLAPGVASQGIVHIGGRSGSSQITVDSSAVDNCRGSELEISPCNVSFEEQNCLKHSKNSLRSLALPVRSVYNLNPVDFPSTGVYQARAWAKNARGDDLGLSSDHIMIVVDGPAK